MMSHKYIPVISVLSLSLVLTACGENSEGQILKQYGANPDLPAPQNFLMPPMKVPKAIGWKEGEKPIVAPGLKIQKIADGLLHPRQVYTLPNDDILVVESNGPGEPISTPKLKIMRWVQSFSGVGGQGGNRITLLRKSADDAMTYTKSVFLENLHSPFGVQLVGDTLYVANTDQLIKYKYVTGQTKILDPGVGVADLPGGEINHHWTKSLLASKDGKKLYVGVGSNSNITENGLAVEYRRANVLEIDAETGASRIYASGLRNPTGLQWEPETGKLWAVANERDEIGGDLVPDYLTSVKEGAFYGWPFSYYGQHVDVRVRPQNPALVASAIKPDYALSSHVAPLGLLFYTGTSFPEKYHGGAFISEHGSWDRSPLNGYRVAYIAFKEGKPVGNPEPVVTGFLTEDESKVHGLPVGLTTDNQGALIIADDAGNSVWRVSTADAK